MLHTSLKSKIRCRELMSVSIYAMVACMFKSLLTVVHSIELPGHARSILH